MGCPYYAPRPRTKGGRRIAGPAVAVERPLKRARRYGRSWPIPPVEERRLNGRYRDIAAVGNAKLNGSKGRLEPFRA